MRIPTLTIAVVLAGGVLAGCAPLLSLTEKVAIGFSMLRSPITLRTPEVNSCLEADQRRSLDAVGKAVAEQVSRQRAVEEHFVSEVEHPRCRRLLHRDPRFDRVDDHRDVIGEETLVLVAISGGGARAARLGAHVLGQLEERYNAHAAAQEGGALRPFACQVAAFSTVSGGSIYVSYVASRFAAGSQAVGEGCTDPARAEAVRRVFQDVRDSVRATAGQRHLGSVGGAAYVSPTFLFLLPAMTLLTDRSFLDVLAHGVNLTHERYFSETMLGELPQRPRFFFNTAAVETNTPFVLTQRIQHLPSDYEPEWTARIDVPRVAARDAARPLMSSMTLEELNSSPALFPLPYAAMASAAFPPVMEPLELREYGLDEETREMYPTERTLHLADGGVFDNSGLITAVDFFEHVVHEARRQAAGRPLVRRLILLSINAETSRAVGHRISVVLGEENPWNVGVNWPIRHLGAKAIDQIHFTNKRRGEAIAWERLLALQRSMLPGVRIELLYFPVNLAQLSELDPFAIEAGEETFQKVTRIPTDYVIRLDHDRLLEGAVEQILAADQSAGGRHPDVGWAVGPGGEKVYRLGEAFVRALSGAAFSSPH